MEDVLKRICYFFFFILYISIVKAQTPTIQLNILGDLSTIDFAALAIEENLQNQPRIMQVIINPPGIEVIVEGKIEWRKELNKAPVKVAEFRTKPFISRIFSNDELNKDIELVKKEYNDNIVSEIREIAKPTGIFNIEVNLYYPVDNPTLVSSDSKELIFLNPSPPIILSPNEGSVENIGSILVTWTKSLGANSYKILANYLKPGETYEQALNSGNPLVNNKEVEDTSSINLVDYLDRELISDTTIVLAIKAVVNRPGGPDELMSPIVSFRIGKQISDASEITNIEKVTNIELERLINLLRDHIDEDALNILRSGNINFEQIQFFDENGNAISFSDLTGILNHLELDRTSIISGNFRPR
ncbi:hypothetical protein [Rosettibacter firmus]|uniref:hypothetical protein n=1 Tax=Rosettibacter firmus TaxID=3111522 RepID=UPI00336C0825